MGSILYGDVYVVSTTATAIRARSVNVRQIVRRHRRAWSGRLRADWIVPTASWIGPEGSGQRIGAVDIDHIYLRDGAIIQLPGGFLLPTDRRDGGSPLLRQHRRRPRVS